MYNKYYYIIQCITLYNTNTYLLNDLVNHLVNDLQIL